MWLGEAGFGEREEAGLWAGEPDGKLLPFAEIGGRGGTDRFLADQQWVCGLEGAGSGSGQHWREEPGQGLSLVHLKIRGPRLLVINVTLSKEAGRTPSSPRNGSSAIFFPIAHCLGPSQMAPASLESQPHPSPSTCLPK